MPTLTRWYLKLALIYLVVAVLLSLVSSAAGSLDLSIPTYIFRSIYFHSFMVGWVTQLIFGVVYWMFPKVSRENPRGNETLAWLVFYALNLGLALRLVGEPAYGLKPVPVWGWVLAISATLQWLAGMLFVLITWSRVKER